MSWPASHFKGCPGYVNKASAKSWSRYLKHLRNKAIQAQNRGIHICFYRNMGLKVSLILWLRRSIGSQTSCMIPARTVPVVHPLSGSCCA